MKRWLIVVLGLIAVLAVVIAWLLTPPEVVPEGEQSAALYSPGALGIEELPLELIDRSRPTAPNGDFPGSDERVLKGMLWTPAETTEAPYPLVVYSHGFMSNAEEARYYAEYLVPKGYAVAAVTYPLSTRDAPGGPNARDVRHQPGDVSFVIDALLERNAAEGDRLHGQLDPDRIAVAGLSLGGLTTILAGFHREWRDPRIKAAAAIAGPAAYFNETFFDSSRVPLLMIAGSADAIVRYEPNAAQIPQVDDNAILVTLDKGSHLGFAARAASLVRWADHPDAVACPLLLRNLDRDDDSGEPLFEPDEQLGIVAPDSNATPCPEEDFGRAMRPARQLMLTRLALYAFFESVLASEPSRRADMREYLLNTYGEENSAARVTPSSRNFATRNIRDPDDGAMGPGSCFARPGSRQGLRTSGVTPSSWNFATRNIRDPDDGAMGPGSCCARPG